MEKVLQKEGFKIYCGHCDRIVENVWICKMDSIIGIRYALLCNCCERLIGIYSYKEFNKILETHNITFNEFQIPLN